MGEGDCIACILELAEQFRQGNQLAGVSATTHLKHVFQERRLFDPGHLQDVALNVGLDQGITDVLSPAGFIANQAGRTWVATEIDVLVQ